MILAGGCSGVVSCAGEGMGECDRLELEPSRVWPSEKRDDSRFPFAGLAILSSE